jgi:hypothetical protein
MQPLVESLLALALMLAGAGAGTALRRALPDHHLDENAKDIVRLGAALVATITALVLGLLINSAYGSFEAQRTEVRQIAADVILLDTVLDNYGAPALATRRVLRETTAVLVDQVWHGREPADAASPLGSNAHALYNAIAALPVATPLQSTLKDQGLVTAIRLARTRLALFEQSRARLPEPILYVVVFWLTALFTSFCLFTPLNPTSMVALALVALCGAAALYLILDMQQPFVGLMRVSPSALTHALPPLSG